MIAVESGANDTAISVTDHGRGIAPATQQQLFRPFAKVEGALTFDNEGMGFSLYLDKLIMTYIGGEIALASKLGQGTTATVRLSNRSVNQPGQHDGEVQLGHEPIAAKEYV